MSFIILTILLVISCILVLRKKYKLSVAVLFSSLLLIIVVGNGWLSLLFSKSFEQPYLSDPVITWQKNNAIVILGGGTEKIAWNVNDSIQPMFIAYSRILRGAQLYHACKQQRVNCEIIITGGDKHALGLSEAAVYQQELFKLGIEKNAIILEQQSNNTYENAKFTAQIIQQHHIQQVVLVTSAFHLKRAILYFAHFNIPVQPVAADYLLNRRTWLPTAYHFASSDLFIHELVGIYQYYFYNFMHWNDAD